MKKSIYALMLTAIVATTAFAISSCTLETSSAGKFDGMWHLTKVDTIATGGTLDLSKERIYWSFQFKLMEAEDKDGNHRIILMRYNNSNNKLVLNAPYAYNREEGDEKLSDPTLLKPYGINNTEEEFDIVKINGNKMQLQSKMLKLSFKKF